MVDHVTMKAYSEYLPQKVVKAVDQRGTPKSEAARLFGISLSPVKRHIAAEGLGSLQLLFLSAARKALRIKSHSVS
jgi:transposase